MTESWFWSTPEWREYLAAYERPHDPHFGADGNLVIELGDSTGMWSRLSKGHAAAISRALRMLEVRRDEFWAYQDLHLAANGHVRPLETFMVMRRWIPDHAHVWVSYLGARPAAAAYFIHHGEGVYYASGPRDPAVEAPGAAHVAIWTAMRFYAEQGYRWLDMGAVPGSEATDKEISIASFKKHFGATTKKWREDYL